MSTFFKVVAFLRTFPLTAPLVAAVDTIVGTVTGNLRYVEAEPLVALGAIVAAANALVPEGAGWKGYAVAYLTAAARYFTTPRVDTR